jgi:hypothetical protein
LPYHETTISQLGTTAGSHPLELDFLRAIKAKVVDLNFNHLKRNYAYQPLDTGIGLESD